MDLGTLDLKLLDDGVFRLDGGAMFGVVPRPLWERKKPPDELNRIRMASHSLLVGRGSELVLVDAGLGDKLDARGRQRFGVDADAARLPQRLRDAGHAAEDVTHVLLTHLHFDHCGWSTRRRGSRWTPTFPRARYWISRREVEHARRPNERDAVSYDPRNWEPLFEAGVVELFEDEAEPVEGVRAIRTPGHNEGMCIVRLDGGAPDAQGVFWADLVPTAAHVAYPWIMSYDLFPLETLANKKRWLPRAAAEGWLCFFQHDSELPAGRIVADARGRLQALPWPRPATSGSAEV